jgi:transposase
MQVVQERCAGLDVHKRTVVACVLWSAPGGVVGSRTRTFGTMTADLRELAAWLAERGCTSVAMEATGVYWKPVYNVLEAHGGFELVVANAEHLRTVPGRKTDVKDAQWIAELMRHGLLRASFIPDRAQRELRELTRYRTALARTRADEVNRLQKTLEGANLKLAAVLTDVTGVSGQRILTALLDGQTDPAELVQLAHGRLKPKLAALEQALVGQVTGPLQFLLRQQLRHLAELETLIEACDTQIAELPQPFATELARLRTIPGIGRRTAEVLVAEVGTDLTRFPSAGHLAAWAGLAPGNKASGGKRQPARARKGSPWLRAALTEAAWAASHCKEGYLPAQFRRLAARRGKKRALVAVGHSILVSAYHLLTRGEDYCDLGGQYFDERDRERVRRRTVHRLEALGYDVYLTEREKAG